MTLEQCAKHEVFGHDTIALGLFCSNEFPLKFSAGVFKNGFALSIDNRSKFIQINTCPFHALKPVLSHEVTSMRNELKSPSLKRA